MPPPDRDTGGDAPSPDPRTDAADWPRIKALFAELSELTPAQQQARLAELDRDAPPIAAELRTLLDHAQSQRYAASADEDRPKAPGATPLATGAGLAAAASILAEAPDSIGPSASETIPTAGGRIGPWKLLEPVGQGGMGQVWRAERADGAYRQQVAIKLLRTARPDAAEVARLARERQLLARLTHPNIARLIDGGVEGTLHYLALEFVDGAPIDVYCRQQRLDLRQRVALVVKLCDAVQSAHQNLLIHRDIKPANVMVGADGEPKLLDFGIARLLEQAQSESGGASTLDTSMMFTPRYASPEQAGGRPVTVATDVFGLGLLLYDLLAGASPFERIASEKLTSAATAVRALLEDAPRSARAVAAATPDAPFLPERLDADIDAMLLKACAKDPAERYATVADLKRDLQRWLDGEPVAARVPSALYVAGKFVGRHKLATALATLALAGIVAALAWALVERQRVQARNQQLLRLASDIATDIYPALEELSGSTQVRAKLAQSAVKHLDDLAAAEPAPAVLVQLAEAQARLADVFFNHRNQSNLGDRAAAERAQQRARELLARALAQEPANPAALGQLAKLDAVAGLALAAQGQGEAARERLDMALGHYARLAQARRGDAQVHFDMGVVALQAAQAQANLNQSGQRYIEQAERALAALRAAGGDAGNVRDLQLFVYRTQQREAEHRGDLRAYLRIADTEVAELERLLADKPDNAVLLGYLMTAYNNSGLQALKLGEIDDALRRLRRAIELTQAQIDKDPNDANLQIRSARSHTHLGRALLAKGDLKAAIAALDISAGRFERARAKDLPPHALRQAAEAHAQLGELLARAGEPARAVAAARAALAVRDAQPALFTSGAAADWVARAERLVAANGRP